VRSFVVTAPAAEAELATDALFGLGVMAVEERSGTSPAEVELWTHVGEDDAAIAAAASALADRWATRVVPVDDEVVDGWRAHAEPTWIDETLVIVPAWLDRPESSRSGVLAVPIDPGAAFGLGDHPTTVLTIRQLRAIVAEAGAAPQRVLDVGSGSGVLGIVAALLGAPSVTAIDHHAAAVAATVANAVRNGVAGSVTASGEALADVAGTFDVVLANLLAPTIVDLAVDLRRLTAPGGRLVISGVLDGRYHHAVAALRPFDVVAVSTLDGWAAIELRAPAG
jgi:ribosomal protein L11 methyltransferase